MYKMTANTEYGELSTISTEPNDILIVPVLESTGLIFKEYHAKCKKVIK